MSNDPTQQPTYIIPPPSAPNWKTPVVAGVLILLVASNVFLFIQLDRVKTESRTEVAKLGADLNATMEKIRVDSSESVQRAHRNVEALRDQLAAQRAAANEAVGQAKIDAQKRVEALQAKVATEEAMQRKAIEAAKQSADTANTKIADVSTDVGVVKTDVQNTKSELEQTVANLKRVTGDVDGQASLIATNSKELDALKALGTRNYSEFTINRGKDPTRVGSVMIQLKKVDPKNNRFTIELTVDDIKVEKKDRTVNEPIQFLTSKATQPDEIVVNKCAKNQIVGYLATPKVQIPRS